MWVFSSYRFKIHIHVFRSLKVILISVVFHWYYINSLPDNCNEMIEYTYFTCFFLCLYIVIDHSLPFRKKIFEKTPIFSYLVLYFLCFQISPRWRRETPESSLYGDDRVPRSSIVSRQVYSCQLMFISKSSWKNVFLALSSIWRNPL